ncbi:hypothetical protein I302_106822 [Kwoniella bestiolae CBS 10118]|uniref:Uncharacterized protein n=1 Tax=Kwoniella bestiolae CBS 10118 TaxID=1296100 RepID=A0A1B9G0A9_9TREE|nr:hypothetical protein I302_05912 [Kwoniella bestiolae CBS 10118]OCF24452.1 hypothetical protein I302_05912 [Kwoniella bestiolae CBS 10118]
MKRGHSIFCIVSYKLITGYSMGCFSSKDIDPSYHGNPRHPAIPLTPMYGVHPQQPPSRYSYFAGPPSTPTTGGITTTSEWHDRANQHREIQRQMSGQGFRHWQNAGY